MDLKNGDGLSFFAFPGVSSPNLFKQLYRSRMNSVELTEEERNGVLEEAVRAFEFNIQVRRCDNLGRTDRKAKVPLRGQLISSYTYWYLATAADRCSVVCVTGLWRFTEDADCLWQQPAELDDTVQGEHTPHVRKHLHFLAAQDGPGTVCGSGYCQCGNVRFIERNSRNTVKWSVAVEVWNLCFGTVNLKAEKSPPDYNCKILKTCTDHKILCNIYVIYP